MDLQAFDQNGDMHSLLARIDYVNYKNERRTRIVRPIDISFQTSKWHPTPQWVLVAYDTEKEAMRFFAMKDIHSFQATEIKDEIQHRANSNSA